MFVQGVEVERMGAHGLEGSISPPHSRRRGRELVILGREIARQLLEKAIEVMDTAKRAGAKSDLPLPLLPKQSKQFAS